MDLQLILAPLQHIILTRAAEFEPNSIHPRGKGDRRMLYCQKNIQYSTRKGIPMYNSTGLAIGDNS